MKRLAYYTFVVCATLMVAILAWEFSTALTLFLFSLAVAAAFRPSINHLTKRGMSPSKALVLVYSVGLAGLALLLLLVSPLFLRDLQELANDFAISYHHVLIIWSEEGTSLQRAIANQLIPLDQVFGVLLNEEGTATFQTMFGMTWMILELLGMLALVVVLSVYWTADQARFERLWLLLIPGKHRARARNIWRDIEYNLGAYISSELIQAILAGILLGVGYWLMELKYAVILGIVGALISIVPLVSILLALIPVAVVGLIASTPSITAVAAIYTVLVLALLQLSTERRLFNRRRFSGFLLVLVMILFTDAFGFLGLIIAPPFAIATQILASRLVKDQISTASLKPALNMVGLEERLAVVRDHLTENEEDTPQLESMLSRLETLIQEVYASSPEQKNAPVDISTVPPSIDDLAPTSGH